MLYYYLQKGIMPSQLFNASEGEKVFAYWAMVYELERKQKLMEEAAKKGFACPIMALLL